MDASEVDDDIRIQRNSEDLLNDFQKSLAPFLYNDTLNNTRVRRRVRISELERLVSLVLPPHHYATVSILILY